MVVAAALLTWQFLTMWTFDPGARAAVDALYGSSAFAAPDAPGIVDVDRARQVIGDRPIVVAVLSPKSYSEDDNFDRCRDVVAQHADLVAFVHHAPGASSICVGEEFPDPDTGGVTASAWLELVILDSKYSSRYRVLPGQRDHTAQVEEFVLAFDAAVPAHYADGVPRREIGASPRVGWEIAARLLGTAAAIIAAFLLLRRAAAQVIADRVDRAALRERRLEQLVRLGRLADTMLTEPATADPATARRRAVAAGAYVTLLGDVEGARDGKALDLAESRLGELERLIRRTAPS